MKSIFSFIWEVLKITVVALLIVIPIRYFIFQPFFVKGQSMEPNFENGDYLIIDELSYRFNEPQRGEVVVFRYPNDPVQRYIKRIVGLPKETVEIKDGKVAVFNQEGSKVLEESEYLVPASYTAGDSKTVLHDDEYYVLGDNRSVSSDSRRWGPLKKDYIIGKVVLRAWPFTTLTKFSSPVYE